MAKFVEPHAEKRLVVAGTIDHRYQSIGGFTSGFDYLRLLLAAAVVVLHSFGSSYGAAVDLQIWGTANRIFAAPILLMFFALSGFLVTGSLKRNPSVSSFVTLRVLRLVPALAVEVLLSALVLGPLLTEIPLSEYFSSREFLHYFGNIVGRIRLFLPGVFSDNPVAFVNISLWTIPFELECYLALIALWLSGFLKKRVLVVAVTLAAIGFGTGYALVNFEERLTVTGFAGAMPRPLIAAFLVGVCISLYSDVVKVSWQLAALSLAGLVLTTLVYQTAYLATIFSAYLVIFLGLLNPPKRTFLLRGDYSYGLYLFAFPIQQTYSYLFPNYRYWYFNAMAGLIFGIAYAMFSWWMIEKPVLAHKKAIVGWVEGIVRTMNPINLWARVKS